MVIYWPKCLKSWLYIRDIRKVRKTQHQNPEFGQTQGEIQKKNLAKKYISIQEGGMKLILISINFGRKPSFVDRKLFFIVQNWTQWFSMDPNLALDRTGSNKSSWIPT
jgi:hypothetical protein